MVIGISVIIIVLDFLLIPKNDGSLLIGLLFWAGVGQGVIALAAAADLSGGKWIKEIRPYLMQYYPLLLMFPITFLIFARHITVYAWAANPVGSGWLKPSFFIVRNAVILLLPFIIANFYVRAVKRGAPGTGMWAALYLFFFVVSQSFMAFDIVMTFEYPWVNTLFGGYFFVESLYAGIAFCAILTGVLVYRDAARFKPAFNDFTLMLMGFALLWAGLLFPVPGNLVRQSPGRGLLYRKAFIDAPWKSNGDIYPVDIVSHPFFLVGIAEGQVRHSGGYSDCLTGFFRVDRGAVDTFAARGRVKYCWSFVIVGIAGISIHIFAFQPDCG